MNNLNNSVLGIIYKYKHQLEFKDVLDELIQHKIHCKYNVTIEMLKYMFYVNQDGFKIACIDVSSISVFAYEILNEIKKKK
jgi:hypothetical protein